MQQGYLLGRGFVYPDYKPMFPRTYRYEVSELSLSLNVWLDESRVEGMASYTLDSWGALELDAVEMEVRGVDVDGRASDFLYDGRQLTVDLKPGHHSVAVKYATSPRKGLYFVRTDSGIYVWSQGESEDNRYWIPLPDSPYVKFPVKLDVTVHPPAMAISNGELVEVSDVPAGRTWRWQLSAPHSPYLIALAAGDFESSKGECDGIPLEYYVPRGMASSIEYSFYRTCDIIKFYEQYTGVKYPWPNYKQISVPEFIYGGMENTTATILTDTTLHDAHAHCPGSEFPCPGSEDFTSDPLVAHELAHQWFGDLVTTEEWPHIWLNESFATLMEALYERHALGEADFQYTLYRCLRTYLSDYGSRYSRPIVFRLYRDPEELFDTHSYEKGCLVLWHLANVVGEDVFRKGIRKYLIEHSHSAVDTHALRKSLEAESKVRLDWFFSQFAESAGHPAIEYSWEYDAGSKLLKLRLAQVQGDDSYPGYSLDLDVLVAHGGIEREMKVKLDERSTTLYVQMDSAPDYVCLDPGFKAFLERKPKKKLEEALAQLSCSSVACRLEAVEALKVDGSNRAVDGLARSLSGDAFWGVRVESARALGSIGGDASLDALLRALSQEGHPRVRQAIADALGQFRANERAAQALKSLLEDSRESYYVRQRAASGLGRAGGEGYEEVLQRALKYGGHNSSITIGAIEGLSKIGDQGAFDAISSMAGQGHPTLVRAAAARALGAFPDHVKAMDMIGELLRDRSFRVRRAAVEAAERALSPRLLDTLDAAAARDIDGRIRRLARDAARRIRDALEKGPELMRLREDVERVREDQRRLEERMSRIERI